MTVENPYDQIGGEVPTRALAKRFYEIMAEREPALARLHACDELGRVAPENQERFALFLIGWLGGPQTYMERHGHPRLRMRHGQVTVDPSMRDAWVRCMTAALDDTGVPEPLKGYLVARFTEVAAFLRNA